MIIFDFLYMQTIISCSSNGKIQNEINKRILKHQISGLLRNENIKDYFKPIFLKFISRKLCYMGLKIGLKKQRRRISSPGNEISEN